ncbi:envelope stress response membrane protein PspB [Sphingomonas rhizophila]|jgi:phage shock protein B|uniref:Envelope stress response membrane protein PspB n=1 Tax=Sphingomonas rhizophila TaxID=2071607 RepID=A0A7G9SDK6_9SPHN|nr:envelope stress response membrane protein PspB [Sphingomonas rhizophila]QNN65931.1 envelope stress response membrane protein PspB [Sphingomonas rhizophila]
MEFGDLMGLVVAMGVLFIGLPWLVFHYITKWKTAARLTGSDEKLLDELHDAARRLDDRLCSIERIMTAENPDWRRQCLPPEENYRERLLPSREDAR